MSYKKQTRIKPDLPPGDWSIVLRLADFAGVPYGEAHSWFMLDSLRDPELVGSQQPEVSIDDGVLYAKLSTRATDGTEALRRGAALLRRGLVTLALDPIIDARIVPTDQLNPQRPLHESFPYLRDDVTLEVQDYIDDLRLHPALDPALDFELDHLANA